MAANSKAVQVRVDGATASQIGHQRAHDLRIGPQPAYVDENRSHLNRVLIENATGVELRKLCEERRAQRDMKRAMKSNASVGFSGIITFGHAAQIEFEKLSATDQDEAFRRVAERVAERLETSVHGLSVHLDETSIHAHFQLAGVTHDGHPVSSVAKWQAMKDLQTIAAEVMKQYAPAIERGKSRRERLDEGETYAETVHKKGAEMRALLGDELPELRRKRDAQVLALKKGDERIHDQAGAINKMAEDAAAIKDELAALRAKIERNERLAEKARAKADEETERGQKAARNADLYERRANDARNDLEKLESLRDEARAELEQVERVVAQKKTKVRSLRERRNALRSKSDRSKSRSAVSHQSQISELSEKLSDLQANAQRLKAEIAAYQNG